MVCLKRTAQMAWSAQALKTAQASHTAQVPEAFKRWVYPTLMGKLLPFESKKDVFPYNASPKDIKMSIQETRSDTDFEKSVFTTSEDEMYNPNDFLAFIAFVEFVYDSDCDSDDEFIDEEG
ncbi:hypothetical protein CK203_002102 [Vitis vinifera]|uniref:Uncharacterized protein n=1 Tax=Vitis vinifera TaxID=29760 RepID=A0A438KJF8_VITVI|nr:hypothetical protein CK203_002102 [Vitis vinifera]